MSKIAFLFPGQASQYPGMGKDHAANFAESRTVFEEADAALGFSISQLCFEGSEDALKLTENTQPAILTVSVAAYRALAARGIQPDFAAGHSLGSCGGMAPGALVSAKCPAGPRLHCHPDHRAVKDLRAILRILALE